jgi:[ribosomal protein S5]-alanine N-acetyltransferase
MLKPRFQPFPELVTEQLLLRQIHVSDAPEIFSLRSDKRVLEFIGKEPAQSIQEAEAFIKMINDLLKGNESILWGIALRNKPGTLIGTICYWNMQKENYRTEIGYALHPDYWKKGLMKEAMLKVLDYGFHTIKFHSVEARVHAGNSASLRILEAVGFEKEGYFKEDFYFKGHFNDTVVYSKLNKKS